MIHWPSMRQAAPGGGSGISVLGSTDASAEVSAGSWSAVSGETALVAESHAVYPRDESQVLGEMSHGEPLLKGTTARNAESVREVELPSSPPRVREVAHPGTSG
jgi:hypothetical protein